MRESVIFKNSYFELVFSKDPISTKVQLILLHVLSELKLYEDVLKSQQDSDQRFSKLRTT